MTTDPVVTPIPAIASPPVLPTDSTSLTPMLQSPTKSPSRDQSPLHLATTPSKADITPNLAPSVAAESGSPSKSSSYSPTKTLHSPIQNPRSPLKSPVTSDMPLHQSLSPAMSIPAHNPEVSVRSEMENFSIESKVDEEQDECVVLAPVDEESIALSSASTKTPVKRGRVSNNNGASHPRKKSSGGSASTSITGRKSISASSLVRADSFAIGDLVFARVKGHPWWPGRVLEEKHVPEKFLRERRNSKERCIMFYNTDQYGFLTDEFLVPFLPNVDALATNASVKKAIKVAETNPEAIYDRIESIKKMSTEDEIEYDDEEYDNRASTSTKSRKSVADRKSVASKSSSNKRRAPDQDEESAKPSSSKRSKPDLPVPTSTAPSRSSQRKAGIVPAEGATDMLMRWRHVLQKTFIKDKSIDDKPRISPETIHTVDFQNIKQTLDEFHEYMMGPTYNAEDVANTKLHKVVRLIGQSPAMIDADPLLIENDIPARVIRLADALRFRIEAMDTTE